MTEKELIKSYYDDYRDIGMSIKASLDFADIMTKGKGINSTAKILGIEPKVCKCKDCMNRVNMMVEKADGGMDDAPKFCLCRYFFDDIETDIKNQVEEHPKSFFEIPELMPPVLLHREKERKCYDFTSYQDALNGT